LFLGLARGVRAQILHNKPLTRKFLSAKELGFIFGHFPVNSSKQKVRNGGSERPVKIAWDHCALRKRNNTQDVQGLAGWPRLLRGMASWQVGG
jgi:hypothetical protein